MQGPPCPPTGNVLCLLYKVLRLLVCGPKQAQAGRARPHSEARQPHTHLHKELQLPGCTSLKAPLPKVEQGAEVQMVSLPRHLCP